MLTKYISIIMYDYYNIYNFISFTNDKHFTNYPTTQGQIGILEQYRKINIERSVFGANIFKYKFGFSLNYMLETLTF